MRTRISVGVRLTILLILLLLLGSLVQAYSCTEYIDQGGELDCAETDDPTPVITINYYEEPVDIESFGFFEGLEQERTIAIYESGSVGRVKYNYTVSEVLLDGYYEFVITAQDDDGNDKTSRLVLAVDVDDMDIWIQSPAINYIYERNQTIAIGKQLPFNITMRTQFDASCRMRLYSGIEIEEGDDPDETLEKFYDVAYWRFNNGNSAETQYHRISATTPAQASENRSRIEIDHSFDYTDLANEDYAVICRREVTGNQYVYDLEKLYIGYDDTPFTFSANFNPESITDYSQPQSTSILDAPNELIACFFEVSNNQAWPLDARPETGTTHQPINDMEDHQSNYERNFTFNSQTGLFNPDQQYLYAVNFTCYNPAMWRYSVEQPFSVGLTTEFSIELEEEDLYLDTRNPTFHVYTTALATCYYSLDGDNEERIGENEDKADHIFDETINEDGYHELEIRCDSVARSMTETFGFSIDTTRPATPTITGPTKICSGDISVIIQEPDERLAYNYTIANSSSFNDQTIEIGPRLTGSYTDEEEIISASVDLVPEKSYFWRVYSVDRAGHQSSGFATHKVVIKNASGIDCDEIDPVATVEVEKIATGYTVNVTCMDAHSGCAPTYNYSFIGVDDDCADTPPTTKKGYDTGLLTFATDGKLCYAVYDLAGNAVTGSQMVTPEMKITLAYPRLGIAETKTFNLQIETSRDVTCKHGYNGASRAPTDAQWYASLTGVFGGAAQTHSAYIDPATISQLDDGLEEDSADWVVICKDGDNYQTLEFQLGFDTSDPTIQVSANPNPIVDPGDVMTTLRVTADDPVVCTYLDEEVIPTGFGEYDPTQTISYEEEHTTELEYWGLHNETVTQEIWCMNLAQQGVDQTYDIDVQLTDEVGIQVNTQRYHKISRIVLDVTTEHEANCEYRVTPEGTYRDFTGGGTNDHKATIDLAHGEYDVEIHCTSTGSGGEGTVFHNLIVDRLVPTLEIITAQETCSLEGITATFLANGTGSPIANYTYEITDGEEIIAAGTQSNSKFSVDLDLEDSVSYMIAVTVFDRAGNSRKTSKNVVATPYSALSCDTTPPKASVKVTQEWAKAAVEVTCTDSGSGCSESYGYVFVEEECVAAYSSQTYADQPIYRTESGLFCYEVYDQANNAVSGSKQVKFNNHCFNGIEDNYEKGVDCGGPCDAQCDTCDNGKLDPFEEDVDCGGVCETVRSCTTFAPVNNTGQSCIFDSNCPTGQECVDGFCAAEDDGPTTCTTDNDCPGFYDVCDNGICKEQRNRQDDCSTDEDCGYGEVCVSGTCVADLDSGINILGLIFIILGVLLMGGGIYYIYYTEQQKQQYHQRQQAYQQQMTAQQRAAQRAAQLKHLQDIKKRHEEGEAQRQQKLKERKDKRKNLLGSFAAGEEPEEFEPEVTPEQPPEEEIKNKGKLDEGKDDEYVDLSHMAEANEHEEGVFKDLEKVAEGKDPEEQEEVKEKIEKPKATIMPATEKHLPKEKQEDEEEPSPEEDEDEQEASETFTALEHMIKEANSQDQPNVEHLTKHTKDMKTVDSQDFVNAFTKDIEQRKLDQPTLISLLHVLIQEDKINLETAKEILEKLAAENFITKDDLTTIFTQLN